MKTHLTRVVWARQVAERVQSVISDRKVEKIAMADKPKFLNDLRTKRTLIFHTYDTFVERQTRLSFSGALKGLSSWEEIKTKRNILMIDDVTVFSIAGRRLIDLCKLQSAAEGIKIKPLRLFDDANKLVLDYRNDRKIGFYSVLSRIIHMSYFFYYDTKRDFKASLLLSTIERYNAYIRPLTSEDAIDGFIITRENKHPAMALKLCDIINSSIRIAETIIEVCASAGIDLEAFERDI